MNADGAREVHDTHDIGAEVAVLEDREVQDTEGDTVPHLHFQVPVQGHVKDTDVTDDHQSAVRNDTIVVVSLL